MTKTDLATEYGITVERLNQEMMEYLQSEGYDDKGNEYETLDAWIARKSPKQTVDPVDGGRGAGQYGTEDY